MEIPSPSTERFQTLTTILIAIVSTAIALVASQVAVVSGDTTESQHDGVLAKINLERVDGGSRVIIARYERAFSRYRFNRELWLLTFDYISAAEAGGQSAHGTRLRQEAAGLREEFDIALQFVHTGYLIRDEEGEYADFDEAKFISDERQTAAIYQDIDFDDNFAAANLFRSQSLAMSASVIVLFLSVMFLTWAQITRSVLRWVWLAAGVLIAVGTGLAYAAAGLANVMGLG